MMNASGDQAAMSMSAPHIDMYIVCVIEMSTHVQKIICQHAYWAKDMPFFLRFISA